MFYCLKTANYSTVCLELLHVTEWWTIPICLGPLQFYHSKCHISETPQSQPTKTLGQPYMKFLELCLEYFRHSVNVNYGHFLLLKFEFILYRKTVLSFGVQKWIRLTVSLVALSEIGREGGWMGLIEFTPKVRFWCNVLYNSIETL